MFAVKLVTKSGVIKLYNNPSCVYFDPNHKSYYGDQGLLEIYDGGNGSSNTFIHQNDTQTPLDVIYANIEKAFEENRMVTICLDS